MKIKILFAAILFAPTLYSGVAADPSKVVGLYSGVIYSSKSHPGKTRFAVSPSGKINGVYEFGAKNNRESGTLSHCKLTQSKLKCRWTDAYGKGTLKVQFSTNFCAFQGLWFAQGDRGRKALHYVWTGQRANCKAENS